MNAFGTDEVTILLAVILAVLAVILLVLTRHTLRLGALSDRVDQHHADVMGRLEDFQTQLEAIREEGERQHASTMKLLRKAVGLRRPIKTLSAEVARLREEILREREDVRAALKALQEDFRAVQEEARRIRETTTAILRKLPSPEPPLRPTGEQRAVCQAVLDGPPAIRVEAFAGTGKTTTLWLVARDWLQRAPSSRVLYVTFNRHLKKEATEKFRDLDRVEVLTNHGLAYREVGRAYKDKLVHGTVYLNRLELVERLGKEQSKALRALQAMGFRPEDAAVLLLEAVDRFTQSADDDIGPEHFSESLSFLLQADRRALDDVLVPLARWVWGLMRDREGGLRITHDGYLKVYQLSRPDLSDRYDLIMFDEAQDANPAMLDILLRQEEVRRVFVGDRHQQIYAWRGAVNAMERLADWPAFPLTRSWRFGPAIAELASRILQTFKGETRSIEGNPARASRVGPVERPRAILTRTNVGAVEEILTAEERTGRVPALTGSVRELTEALKAAYRLWRGEPPGHPEFSVFRSWAELKEFVRQYPFVAFTYQRYVRFVEKYKGEIPSLCRFLEKNVQEDDGRADLTVSTVHRAKGRQWETVRLGRDFEDVTLVTPEGHVLEEEVNLAYVAVTRAVGGLDPGPLADVIERDAERLRAPRQGRKETSRNTGVKKRQRLSS